MGQQVIKIFLPKYPMSRYKLEREYIFSNKGYKEICDFLKQYKDLDLSQVHDDKGNTALHQCAFTNEAKILRKYIEAQERFLAQSEIENPFNCMTEFLNARNNDGLTAIHFAAYKGHYKILQELQRMGADVKAVTPSNQNVLHLAAQGDKVETFIFFESTFDINFRDSKKSTSLHWASYMNSESIVTYLLVQPRIELNPVDEHGQTPLHLATAYGNTKIVKKLLRAGAERDILNSKGETAMKIASDNEFKNIQKLLNDNYGLIDRIKLFLNIKTKYVPQERSLVRPSAFIMLLLLTLILRFGFFIETQSQWLNYFEMGAFLLLLIVYVSLLFKPNQGKTSRYIQFLHSNIKLKKICLICVREKPKRSMHCDICKICIQRYDHHCFWINNCVGKHNFKRFIFLIIYLQLFLLAYIVNGIFLLTNDPHYYLQLKDWAPQSIRYILCAFYLVPGAIFSVPLMLLVLVQLKNILLNKTTYERFNKDRVSTLVESSSHLVSSQPKRHKKSYKIRNCCVMCYEQPDNKLEINSSTTDSLLDN